MPTFSYRPRRQRQTTSAFGPRPKGRRLPGMQRQPRPWTATPQQARPIPTTFTPSPVPQALTAQLPQAPAAPAQAAPAPTARPFDPIYEQQTGLTQKAYNDALAQLQGQRLATKQEYGFEDVTNPFSRAKMLQESYQRGQQAQVAGMAARGGLYSGALQQRQELGTQGYQRNRDVLQRQYQGALADIGGREAQALSRRDQALLDALRESIARAQEVREEYGEPEPEAGPAAEAPGVPGMKGQPLPGVRREPRRKPRREPRREQRPPAQWGPAPNRRVRGRYR